MNLLSIRVLGGNVVAGGLLLCLGVLTPISAQADMGPDCGCEVGAGAQRGRGALAASIGVLGGLAWFIDRKRRARSS